MRLPVLALTLSLLPAVARGGEAAGGTCGPAGIETVVTLDYADRQIGEVGGGFLVVRYASPLVIPGSTSAPTVRERVQSQLAADVRLVPADEDGDGDGREDRLRLLLAATTGHLRPGPVARIRFDCPAGAPVPAIACTAEQIADAAGQPLRADQAAQVGCTVRVSTTSSPVPTPAMSGR